MSLSKVLLEPAGMEIIPLDLRFRGVEKTIASYLVIGPQGPVLVECGPGSTLPNLIEELAKRGFKPDDVRHVLVTHIHLDHAGCLGWWANKGARVYVHEVGAPHIVQPENLLKSARRIYGDQLEPIFGDVLPARASQVQAVRGGDVLEVGGLRFEAIDTPGHAKHHHVFCLDGAAFTGDAAGVRLPGIPYIDVPAVPPEFDLPAWRKTFDILKSRDFEVLYPTHFGPVHDVSEHLEAFAEHVENASSFIHKEVEMGSERDPLIDRYVQWNRERSETLGVTPAVFDAYQSVNPMSMSVDGIRRYWTKQREQAKK